jgi:hypothetical protein
LPVSSFIGVEYGANFHVSNSKLAPADPSEDLFSLFGLEVDDGERDNRDLKFNSNAQVGNRASIGQRAHGNAANRRWMTQRSNR